MTSFINLLADDEWSEADIVNRTEAIIAGSFPNVEILKRKVTGMMLGQYQLTPEEQAEFGAYAALSFQAGALADAARADRALLADAMAVEHARARLTADPVAVDDPAHAADPAERAAAQAVVDGASADVQALVTLRAPVPEPGPEVLPHD